MDKVSKSRQKKIELVGQFEEKVKRAKALVLTDYRGMTHQQLEALKKALKGVEAELVVTKNTLLKRALEIGNWKLSTKGGSASGGEIGNSLTGPTATLFAFGDVIAPLKELAKTIKALKIPAIKLGLLDGKTLTGEDVLKLATLPSREVLIAQVVGGMKSPIYGLHRALVWNLQRLVLTLKAIEKTKGVTSN